MPRRSWRPWRPLVDRVATIPVPGEPASLDAEEEAAIAARLGIRAMAARDVSEALRSWPTQRDSPPAS